MTKTSEILDPHSCFNRAADSEMLFVLLGRDAAAPATIRFWCQERVRLDKNKPDDDQIIEALRAAARMEREAYPPADEDD